MKQFQTLLNKKPIDGLCAANSLQHTHTHNLQLFQRVSMHVLLTVCCILGVNSRTPAQSIPQFVTLTNTAYNVHQYEVDDDASFSTGDPRINLTMDCLAANGYGQWTASSNVGTNSNLDAGTDHSWLIGTDATYQNGPGWFLLGNLIAKPAKLISVPVSVGLQSTCQPPGIVSGGKFLGFSGMGNNGYPDNTVKVAANLNGSVRYVWRTDDMDNFVVQGLSDDQGVGNNHTPEIDISVHTLPTTPANRQIVKAQIYPYNNYATIPTATSADGQDHTVLNNENDHRDEFDIACDSKYLYIVWESIINPVRNQQEIWVTAVDIKTGLPIPNFPICVTIANTNGKFPTVACNVRNNPSQPQFDVAYIDRITNQVVVQEFFGTTVLGNHSESLLMRYKDPFAAYSSGPPVVGLDPYAKATHARVLVSSQNVGLYSDYVEPTMHSVYVICQYDNNIPFEDLIIYKPLTWVPANDLGLYVDGYKTNFPLPNQPKPFPSSLPTCPKCSVAVVDEHITAFANPYDAQCSYNPSQAYDEFHCVYQLQSMDNTTNTPIIKKPLLMVRGCDNNLANTGSTADTRLVLNQDGNGNILSDPTSTLPNYVGAVNQMGIHVHWRTDHPLTDPNGPKQHFYARDIRKFDEDIEENTLVTNDCYIADGTSHCGSQGTELISNKKMTIWTDPNYGIQNNTTSSGLYLTEPVIPSSPVPGYYELLNEGGVNYESNSLTFSVGRAPSQYIAGSIGHLYTYPVSCFTQSSGVTDGGAISVNPGSTWDFFGSPMALNNPLVPGSTTLTGDNTVTPVSYATLNIHGGVTYPAKNFTANYGDIEILYEQNISPMNTSSTLGYNASGLFLISKATTLNSSIVNSYYPQSAFYNVIHTYDRTKNIPPAPLPPTPPAPVNKFLADVAVQIVGAGVGTNSSVYTLHSTQTSFTNSAPPSDPTNPGVGVIFYDHSIVRGTCPDKVVFDGNGSFNRMRFHAVNPKTAGLEIQHTAITGINQYMVHIERYGSVIQDNDPGDYKDILVSNNTFSDVLPFITAETFDPDDCIRIEGFNLSNRYGEVNVLGNTIDFTTGNQAANSLENYAIEFINTTGNIEGNTIKSQNIQGGGIRLRSSDNSIITHSYLCGNTLTGISYSGASGILSDHYNGYVLYSQINGCDIGYESGPKDNPKINFSSITGSKKSGIDISGGGSSTSLAEVDVSGYHYNYPDNDVAAYNTISGNTTNSTTSAQVFISDVSGSSFIDYGDLSGGTWANWGNNNTFSTTSSSTNLLIGGAGNIGKVDKNYWGSGINPNNTTCTSAASGYWNTGDCTELDCAPGFSTNTNAIAQSSVPFYSCSPVYPTTPPKDNGSLQPNIQLGYDTCAHLKTWEARDPQTGSDSALAKMQYDSLRYYIERCAVTDDLSYRAFSHLDGAVQLMSTDWSRYDVYRSWLISVLYLNTTTPAYFCACLGSISTTYAYGKYFPLGSLAVDNYLRQHHPECWGPGDSAQFIEDSAYDASIGYDPSHLPSLDSLGLGFLLHQNAVTPGGPLSQTYLASFTTSPNPFKNETTLSFTLNRMSYITIDVYDVLGHKVWGSDHGGTMDAGEHTVTISGANLPSGSLYARISTGFGEVKTVKLVKLVKE